MHHLKLYIFYCRILTLLCNIPILFHCILLSQKFLHLWTIYPEYPQLPILASFPNEDSSFPTSLSSLTFPTDDPSLFPPMIYSYPFPSHWRLSPSTVLPVHHLFLRSRLDSKSERLLEERWGWEGEISWAIWRREANSESNSAPWPLIFY